MNKNDKVGEKKEAEVTKEYEITMKYVVSTSSKPITTIAVTISGSGEEMIKVNNLAMFLDNLIQRILDRKLC